MTLCLLATAGIYGLRDRWMLPIWFFLPIWLAACIGKIAQPSVRMVRLYAAIAVAFILLSIFEHPVKIFTGDSYAGKPVRANAPYVQIATDILQDVQTETGVTCPEVVLVAGDKSALASGNFRRVLGCADAVYSVGNLPARYLHQPPATVLLICKDSTCSEGGAWMPPQWRSAEMRGNNWQHTPFKQNEWLYQHSEKHTEVYEWSLYSRRD